MRLLCLRLSGLALLIVCLASCQTGAYAPTVIPEWLLLWSPPAKGIPASVSLDAAFKMGIVLEHESTPVALPTSAITWLVHGATFGIARVRLDPESTWQTLEILYVNAQQNIWDEGVSSGITDGQPCQDGNKVSGPLEFPEPVCSNAVIRGMRTDAFSFALTSWYSTAHIYMLIRVTVQLHNTDTDGTPVQIDAFTGHMRQSGDLTTIIVPIDANQSMLIASSAGNAITVQLAQAMVAHRDNLVPWG